MFPFLFNYWFMPLYSLLSFAIKDIVNINFMDMNYSPLRLEL